VSSFRQPESHSRAEGPRLTDALDLFETQNVLGEKMATYFSQLLLAKAIAKRPGYQMIFKPN
jgi:hypothetical protein